MLGRTGSLCLALLMAIVLFVFWNVGRWSGQRAADSARQQSKRRVLSASMAPTLYGPAWSMTCESCECPLLFDRFDGATDASVSDTVTVTNEETPAPSLAFDVCCSNCGSMQSMAACQRAKPVQQQVVVEPFRADDGIDRDRVVVAQDLPDARFFVKRAIGLPGEQVAIHQGDIYIDQRLLQKEFADVASLAIPVHRDLYRQEQASNSGGTTLSRWRSSAPRKHSEDTTDGGWRTTEEGFEWIAATDDAGSEDVGEWLEYSHSPALPPPFPTGKLAAVKDNVGYNQRLSRSLNDAKDLWMRFIWSHDRALSLHLKLRYGSEEFFCVVTPASEKVVLQLHGESLSFPCTRWTNDSQEFIFGVLDGRLGLSVDGTPVFMHPIQSTELPVDGDSPMAFVGHERPFSIRLRSVDKPLATAPHRTAIGGLEIHRDIYYLPPERSGRESIWRSRRLGDDEYLLLGDNSAVSVDARQSEAAGYVRRRAIVGQVIGKAN